MSEKATPVLTYRAKRYLRALERESPVATETVEDALRQLGWRCDPWLAFHEAYAGYVERIGQETIVWGVMRRNGVWISGPTIAADGPADEDALIACADCHPSYDYNLDIRGEFSGLGGGGSAECFSIKVERSALLYFLGSHSAKGLSEEQASELLNGSDFQLVDEASDKFATYYASPTSVLEIGQGGSCLLSR